MHQKIMDARDWEAWVIANAKAEDTNLEKVFRAEIRELKDTDCRIQWPMVLGQA